MTAQNTKVVDEVVILGAGVAGLATALALHSQARRILLLERDEDAPPSDPELAFAEWGRAGVPQLRHTHIFLARLHSILRARHPELLSELREAGMSSATMDELLPPALVSRYVARPGDEELLHLWGHRATFEAVLRRHVERLPNVGFRFARVQRLIFEKSGGDVRAVGIEVKHGSRLERYETEIVVDTSGRNSTYLTQLSDYGVRFDTRSIPSGCAYYCRHYQLDPDAIVERGGTATNVDYLIAGLFVGERGKFSIAFACRDDDEPLKHTLRDPDGFDGVCRRIPSLARWTGNATATTRVLGGAGLKNRWHRFSDRSAARVLGFFPLGDSFIQTNPIYGRGCSMAFVQAHALSNALERHEHPGRRSQSYHAEVRRSLQQPFEFCVNADRTFWARAKRARDGRLDLSDRAILFAYDALAATIDQDLEIAREFLRGQQMLQPSSPFKVLAALGSVLRRYAQTRLRPSTLPGLAPSPTREELVRRALSRDRQEPVP